VVYFSIVQILFLSIDFYLIVRKDELKKKELEVRPFYGQKPEVRQQTDLDELFF
jgi:hypothetical protein